MGSHYNVISCHDSRSVPMKDAVPPEKSTKLIPNSSNCKVTGTYDVFIEESGLKPNASLPG